ncbi:KTSC domain-containing protein [Paraflavitalea speifideaquila]|uniref:KTSC domain-containing protein n=1 Tax=Paraflavitalea speifideaquila TaxID=3076558 RepID=UPI003312FEEE
MYERFRNHGFSQLFPGFGSPEVEFTGGKVYHYLHVKPEVWEDYKTLIRLGGSSGGYVNTRIKPFYDGIRLE